MTLNHDEELICDDRLRERIAANLSAFDVVRKDDSEKRGAAVAITVADEAFGAELQGMPRHATWQQRSALILTRRSTTLKNHPGQWALPGGMRDPGESVVETALRELAEEVDLHLDEGAVLGLLDDFVTRSGFVITPVVVWGGPRLELTFDPAEVASIHRIPIDEFMRDDAPMLSEIPESEHPVLRMPIGDSWMAAPTAAMLYQFREVCIGGRDTRVAHYEQPYFAWR